jgi:hypothetical protein
LVAVVDKPNPTRPALDGKTEGMLSDFCEAHHEANRTAVVNKAVQRFILDDISKNDAVRVAYEALQRQREKKAGPA